MPNFISEDNIEQAILNILTAQMDYRHINCYTTNPDDLNDKSNRETKSEVVLFDILKRKLRELNPSGDFLFKYKQKFLNQEIYVFSVR